MLSRNVAARMQEAGDPLLPFRGVAALLDGADASFGNLESPLAAPEDDAGQAEWDGAIGGKSLIFAAPHAAIRALERHKFRVLGMANNHAMDQDADGLVHTIGRLSAGGIQVAGAGRTLEAAWAPRMIDIRGMRVGFLAASYASLNYGTDERTGTVALIQDIERMAAGVRALRRAQARCIVVAMHAGEEYTAEPSAAQATFARAAIDAGADVVAGSHPHWVQPVERYRRGLIFYSLGNFVFDLEARETREGAAVKLLLGADGGLRAEVVPVEIEDSCCPRPARPEEAARILRRMRLGSRYAVPRR